MLVLIQYKNGQKEIDLNRRKAIRERCLNCTGWSYKMVKECPCNDCPLHPYRSGQGKQNAKKRFVAIKNTAFGACVGRSQKSTNALRVIVPCMHIVKAEQIIQQTYR